MMASEFAKTHIGSVTVGVVSGRELIWTRSYGFAEVAQHRVANERTVYRIGSITKMFTALMLEQLVEAGKVHLSDPVEKYYPVINDVQGRPPVGSSITLMQLGLHTAGLSREPDDMWKFMQGPAAHWQDTLVSALPHVHYIFEPGTRISYSNVGYAVLGAALAAAAGQTYIDYVSADIFTPLGMTHSSFDLNPPMLADFAQGYQVDGSKIDEKTPTLEEEGLGYHVPNGGAFSTVEDLARFCSFLMGVGPEGVLNPTSLDSYENRVPVVTNLSLGMGNGLGFSLLRRRNYVAFGHNGILPGYQGALYINREASLGVIVLTSANGTGAVRADALALRSLDLLSQ
jgi:CubicO group peptidase (beta-lactamase class C family)